MDDLAGLSWTPKSNESNNKPPPMSSGSMNTMRIPPIQARPTPPPSSNGHSSNPPSKPATPANDSFANLVSFGSSNSNNKNLSLLEQQKKLQEEKAKQEAEKRSQYEAQYGGQNAQFWDNLAQNRRVASPAPAPAPAPARAASPDEDDILAAFNSAAPVDASTNFPIPSRSTTQSPLDQAINQPASKAGFDDDDDPFGLGTMKQSRPTAVQISTQDNDDDDFLGLLGKPVSEAAPARAKSKSPAPSSQPHEEDPRDRAVAELVDMGFPPGKAAEALQNTESGADVQAAVGWLLNQAHAESRQKSRSRAGFPHEEHPPRNREDQRPRKQNVPSWMRESGSERHRGDSRSPQPHERDVGELAASFGNSLFKTANSLWKQGSKKVQQAVQEFNHDADPNQPRWMREAVSARVTEDRGARPKVPQKDVPRGGAAPEQAANITDEALLLESDASRPARTAPRRPGSVEPRHPQPAPFTEAPNERRENKNPFLRQPQAQPQQPQPPQQPRRQEFVRDVKSQLTRTALEEQSAQAYVSPARRRRPQQQQTSPPPTEDNSIDLLDSSKPKTPVPTKPPAQAPIPRASKPSTPIPSRTKAPARTIPPVSQSALLLSYKDRESGNEAYKRGDYGAAHEAFTRALSHLPKDHPVTILVLSNRAMTALKIGEPKVAISDADTILAFIGPAKGEGESIEPGNGQASKPMKDFFGKALMRKAEALEHLERWSDAAQTWKQAVEAGHGGSTSIQGRNRCEKAAGISKPAPAAARPTAPRKPQSTPRTSALSDLSGQRAAPTAEAVTRLRAANEAAERADEEKLALTDSVDAKIMAWRDGKQDNLRALLGSLENVLWPESGWKRINMSELILANKVKIQYMKGIAKVHPDKIPTNATTEQRMIAGAVFSTLNEAWDKFRQENNL
ncbi:UBA/TS-N domain protein [Talaromyces stipitatus ATCC 10500]|uniref:UBA/TS-N domain protein n=1 Tax=Talaromyces stipitatus (strain ATCC 10500 / CBS 375.48 / QM 6759 / NRRL 1006) TaxID=441959 RepID=B8M9Q0_TALSN|nr:UBA/TS-N domain protein [Talaromyces stipitatus ATCC 10500]EED18052.1 UBA/TS-N domain protein [Talaromyces stipitatus ATCC 10500]